MANEVGDARRCLSVYPLWRFTSIQKKPISESGIRASRTVPDIRHPSTLARVTGQGAHGIAARGRLGLSSLSQHSTQMTLPRAQRTGRSNRTSTGVGKYGMARDDSGSGGWCRGCRDDCHVGRWSAHVGSGGELTSRSDPPRPCVPGARGSQPQRVKWVSASGRCSPPVPVRGGARDCT